MGDNKPKQVRRPVHERMEVATLYNAEAQKRIAFATTGPTRAERYVVALELACPRCRAARREPCHDTTGEQLGRRVHRERFELASGEP